MKYKQIGVAVLLAVLFCLLAACGKGGDDEEEEGGVVSDLPTEYSMNGEVISALSVEDENVQVVKDPSVIYFYEGLNSSNATASAYASQLRTEDGFFFVDEEFVKTDSTNFSTEEGTVLLAKDKTADESGDEGEGEDGTGTVQEDRVVTLRIDWTEGACTVTVSEAAGKVTDPPPEPEPVSMTLVDAVDYVNNLPPSVLGLSGESMNDYNIYAIDGIVWVDDVPSLRLRIYSSGSSGQDNDLAGSYLLSNDGLHLYRLNGAEGSVEELELP